MDINNTILFGFPVMNTKIDKKSYDRKSIISTIEKNFKINNKRNNWDKTSILHHAYGDFFNPKYHKVNFDTLIPVYKKVIRAMLEKMVTRSDYNFNFSIVSYTCMSNSNHMKAHIHPEVDFTTVHYIQFDKKHHTSTIFENTLPHADHINMVRPDLHKILSNNDALNSWVYGNWTSNAEEDDFYFLPSFLKHRIDPQASKNKNRITVVSNITLSSKK